MGVDDSSKKFISLFNNNKTLGYKYLGYFTNKVNNDKLGTIEDSFQFILDNTVDEIYCSLKELNTTNIAKIRSFSNSNNIILKLIPDSNKLYSKNQNIEFYDDTLVVLNVKKLPFEFNENYFIKRLFDICFSFLVCLLILSWLIPLLWFLIKIESKGPVIFSQKREGLDGRKFICYKFRSMYKESSDIDELGNFQQAQKDDPRITLIGKILRKTNMDELPQFWNVLIGNMSVVGPRPHPTQLNIQSMELVDNYMLRHMVIPGITGLAQVNGCRGETRTTEDMQKRVNNDLYYIQRWNFWLDLQIIIQTVINIFRGDQNAY